jgi:hypothetical protein
MFISIYQEELQASGEQRSNYFVEKLIILLKAAWKYVK